MLVQQCTLDRHRLVLPVSVSKPHFSSGLFEGALPVHEYRALVDTGAQRTVVSRSVISHHDLLRVGHMQFSSLHGPKTHSRYLAAITFRAMRIEQDGLQDSVQPAPLSPFMIEEPFEIADMEPNTNFDLILGFDVLKGFSFNYDRASRQFQIILKP